MLFNVLLNAGLETKPEARGRFINVVLAAGTIRARIQNANGRVWSTNLVSGMAFDNGENFDSVSFVSESSQQCKIWISDIPLTYAPDTTREVGSSSLSSTVGGVFSGVATELLPAEAGRNKVTVSPAGNILLGGVGLNLNNGIPIAAGQVFTLNTQGAVYALETSGSYPPAYTATFTRDDVASPVVEGNSAAEWDNLAVDVINGNYIVTNYSPSNSRTLVKRDPLTFAEQSSVALEYELQDRGQMRQNGNIAFYASYITATGGDPSWFEIDLDSMTYTKTTVTADVTGMRWADWVGDLKAAFSPSNHYVYYNDAGAGWTKAAAPTGSSDTYTHGFALDGNGVMYVLYRNELRWSDDMGATWNVETLPSAVHSSTSPALGVELASGHIYVCCASGNICTVYRSEDQGTTWAAVFDSTVDAIGKVATGIDVKGTTIAMALTGGYKVNVDGETFTYQNAGYNSSSRFAVAGEDGRLYAQNTNTGSSYYSNVTEGQQVKLGGLSVAIMAEIN